MSLREAIDTPPDVSQIGIEIVRAGQGRQVGRGLRTGKCNQQPHRSATTAVASTASNHPLPGSRFARFTVCQVHGLPGSGFARFTVTIS